MMDFYSNISNTKTDTSRLGILGSSAMGGGLGSVIGGGSWMSGMQTGLSIGMYNHKWKNQRSR